MIIPAGDAVADNTAGTGPTAAEVRQEMDNNSVDLDLILSQVAIIITQTMERFIKDR